MITKDSRNIACDAMCDAMCWFSGLLLSFVTTLQDDSKDSRMRGDVLLFWDAMIFRNNFER
jgi:hypothetical protein